MANVIVIGANGRSAREIVSRLKEQKDIKITLFLRQTHRVNDMTSDETIAVEGDARKIEDLKEAFKDQDIVINAMGGTDLDETTQNVVKAMEQTGVKRIIAINAGGIYDELPEPFNSWDFKKVGFMRPINLRSAEAIEHSSLEYTILRPVWLTDKTATEIQLSKKGDVYKGTETSRASIGLFISNIVASPENYKNENLEISQPGTAGDKPAAFK